MGQLSFSYDVLFSIIVVFFSLLYLLLTYKGESSKKKQRHHKNQKKALMVLKTIQNNSIEDWFKSLSYLRKIDPFVFEEAILFAFEKQGYLAIRNHRYTGDGGLDGKVIDKKGDLYLIQAKRYKSFISLEHVNLFSSLISNYGAVKGFFIHTGKTGQTIKKQLSQQVIILSGRKLIEFLSSAD